MIKAIIFDCFGVVYPDTLSLVERRFLKSEDPVVKQAIRDIRLQSDRGEIDRDNFWRNIARTLGVSTQALEDELDKVRGADWELLGFIKELHKSYKTALLSNVGTGFLERIFDENRQAEDYFDAIVASGEIGTMKPEAAAYLAVVKRIGVKPENCLFIDDKQIHCKGAQSVGMQAVLYQNFPQMKRELEAILRSK